MLLNPSPYGWINMLENCAAYDVTRRETFTDLSDIWLKEVELYSTNPDCIKMLVGNKVDRVSAHP
jgi:GTPase SAR1 family protein